MKSTKRSNAEGNLSRRHFLRAAGVAGAGAAISTATGGLWSPLSAATRRWSNPRTWGGKVPGPRDVAIVEGDVVLDQSVRVAGVVIRPGASLTFDPGKSLTLSSKGNVVVLGNLVMQPESAAQKHKLVFREISERRFRGGGMKVLKSDVGLWVMNRGRLDIAGSDKRPWDRTSGGVEASANQITLMNDPVGWSVGDDIVITPTISPERPGAELAYDEARIKAIEGRTITLDRYTRFAHPEVTVVSGTTMTPEVLNLSRNVMIEGTRDGRAHVFIHSDRQQLVKAAALRYVGPRKRADGYTAGVLGRYGLHFHHCMNGSRRSVVESVVVRDCGNHAFVPHMSHGITLRGCISHNTFDDAYWYDPALNRDYAPPTNDLVYDGCVASLVKVDPPFRGVRLSGFMHGAGTGNIARDCVGVGIRGNRDASGFTWPELSHGVWVFEDCVAHNNARHGIFVWQNSGHVNIIDRFIGYHNGDSGISHGAYKNAYVYRNSILFGNREAAVTIHASSEGAGLNLINLECDAANLSDYCIKALRHKLPATGPTLIEGCKFYRSNKANIGWVTDGIDTNPELFEVVNCQFDGNEFWLGDKILPDSLITVNDSVHGIVKLFRFDKELMKIPEWNASKPLVG
jgi:hypothetical protein